MAYFKTSRAFANVGASTTDFVLVPGVTSGNFSINVVSVTLSSSVATSVTFNSKNGASPGVAVTASLISPTNHAIVLPQSIDGWFNSNPGEALTITTGAGGTVAIQITYTLQ
jgi:hypothetical protein